MVAVMKTRVDSASYSHALCKWCSYWFFGLPEDNGQMVAAWQKLFLSGVCVFNNVCGWFKDIFHWILWKKYLRVSFVALITFERKQPSCGFVNGPSGTRFTYWALLLCSSNTSSRVDMWSLCVSFQTGPLCKDIMMMITKKQTNKTTDVPAELRRETV